MGSPGRSAVIENLAGIKEEYEIDFIIVNGENSAGGRGITPKICIDLLRAGAAVVTTGDHVWDQREIFDYFPTEPRLLRPINFVDAPGAGSVVLETAKGKVAVLNAMGRTFMSPHSCSNGRRTNFPRRNSLLDRCRNVRAGCFCLGARGGFSGLAFSDRSSYAISGRKRSCATVRCHCKGRRRVW